MDTSVAQARLVEVVRRLAAEKRAEIDMHKEGEAGLARPDFIWHYLLQSFATMGRSAGWKGLIGNSANYDRVTYPALEALPADDRLLVVQEVCHAAKVRMPGIKARYILGCFERIQSMGGPEAAKAQLLAEPGREGKIRWLKAMPGIGDKYARNIMMDVYHEDFRDSIAIDARIKSISAALEITFPSYSAHEAFYLEVARQAGHFRSELPSTATSPTAAVNGYDLAWWVHLLIQPVCVEPGDLGEVEAADFAVAGAVAEEDAVVDERDGGVAVPAVGVIIERF